jgi:hypothetical protein
METPLTDTELLALEFMASRVPALDALEAFVPQGAQPTPGVQAALSRSGSSRWAPVSGGHHVLVLYEGGWPYDPSELVLRPSSWNHEHCGRCSTSIPSGSLCWVTKSGAYIPLCSACHSRLFGAAQ